MADAAGRLAAKLALAVGGGLVAVRALLPIRVGGASGPDTGPKSGRGGAATPASAQARQAGHETADMQGGTMARLVAGLGLAVALVAGVAIGLHHWAVARLDHSRPALTAEQIQPVTPPLPHLQDDPFRDIAALRVAEDALLGHYAWRGTARTQARIPIGRAMQLVVGHGLDAAP